MERQFNNGDFEKLLRDNANQYRMYPSEKVWKGIDSALHSRRRWYGLTAIIMFLVTGSVVSYFIFTAKAGQNNLPEQKNTIGQNINSTQSPVASNNLKDYTPAVKRPAEIATTIPVANHNTNSYLTTLEPLSAPISESDVPVGLKLNNTLTIIDEPSNTNEPGNTNETSIFYTEQLPFALNIDNGKIAPEDLEIKNTILDKTIIGQSVLKEDTEQKINEIISALASQNVTIAKPKQAKVTAQVYFTPTVSYRKLVENKKTYPGSGMYVPVIDLNNVVKHKPAMGVEFGIEGRYQTSEKFSLKAGFQFNINRYDIRAYSHPTEIATVALSNGSGLDSRATLSNYRNYSGNNYSPNWLENFYFQAAIPVGGELILSDRNDLQWGVSATLQPTYVIGDRAYVLSSDYKNYAKFPDLMRRWNISSGIGTFVSYSTGRIKWQVGPHARYQHLSSFVKELTVKEKLFSVGLKVGATLNNHKK